ncbi:MAG: DNA-3-methyladenine glycosylase [Bacteroidota bacterium]|nr:DNA-3-methyladenine glycosylase [Bacteroidota bacterium]MDX5505907.1 DNA-3-methyladenine glycosylase [Bacteroidota bacterium]
MSEIRIISREFYERQDVVEVAKDLIGKVLVTEWEGVRTSGIIVETEAYCGANDKACHAHLQKRTKRTEVIFGPPGHAYVYLVYGIHNLFNIVTNVEGKADAILIRAIRPLEGIQTMQLRRGIDQEDQRISNGPGLVTQALGIDRTHYGLDLTSGPLRIEDHGFQHQVVSSVRIGVDYAGEDAQLPWRFLDPNDPNISRKA